MMVGQKSASDLSFSFYKMNFAFNFDFKVGNFKSAESFDTATNLFFWGCHEFLMSHQVARVWFQSKQWCNVCGGWVELNFGIMQFQKIVEKNIIHSCAIYRVKRVE